MTPRGATATWPRQIETVLLDAGGVLLDLDYAYLQRLLRAQGRETDRERLSRLEAEARREVHEHVSRGGRVSHLWGDYFRVILARVGVEPQHRDPLIDTLWEAHERFGLWTVAIDGAREAVEQLRQRGFRMGVVSNAEGRVARDLDRAGYRGMFETVIDSHIEGVEKPDPAIFRLALERLGARADRTIYVGDVPAVDVDGARAAGLAPVLLDRHDLYPQVAAPRIGSLPEILALL